MLRFGKSLNGCFSKTVMGDILINLRNSNRGMLTFFQVTEWQDKLMKSRYDTYCGLSRGECPVIVAMQNNRLDEFAKEHNYDFFKRSYEKKRSFRC